MTDAVLAFKRLLEVFDQLGTSYAVGGSLASSVHGIPPLLIGLSISRSSVGAQFIAPELMSRNTSTS